MDEVRAQILVCAGTGCTSSRSNDLRSALEAELKANGLENEVAVVKTGCFGLCELGPIMIVYPEGAFYSRVTPDDAKEIVSEHLLKGRVVTRLLYKETVSDGKIVKNLNHTNFYLKQRRVALRNCGLINPERIEEYIAVDGYEALARVLTEMSPSDVIDVIKASGLRGRGGAGFPTGMKWQFASAPSAVNLGRITTYESELLRSYNDKVVQRVELEKNLKKIVYENSAILTSAQMKQITEILSKPTNNKYVCCNADEGDPGAFMDRSILEGDPHVVLEAMAIAGYAIGASRGFIYVRAEYPIAVHRLEIAIKQAQEMGFLGKDIFGTSFDFDIELRLGSGAFVCGEETALMSSIEGKRGEPRPRPPFPAVRGLFGAPTILNNVETWANVPRIILNGSKWFSDMGTEGSKGTKVFCLVGKINNTGLVEVPMGTTMREIVEEIGGGIPNGKKFKAAQTGGPSGGCIPLENFDVPIDYENLGKIGSMMGSGGLIVMDEDTCMVDIAKFYLSFIVEESCGKCFPCRLGTKRLLEMLELVTSGQGSLALLDEMEELCAHIKRSSLCALGQTAPNPVISTMRYFRDEYVAHVVDKKCPAGVCKDLLSYEILAEKCKGCGLCKKNCPSSAITGEIKKTHVIDQTKCINCGACASSCKFNAIIKN